MICKNCGAEFEGAFCPNCGQKADEGGAMNPGAMDMGAGNPGAVNPGAVPPGPSTLDSIPLDSKTERQGKMIGNILRVAAGVIALVLVIVVCRALFFKSDYKDLVQDFAKAVEKQNGNQLVKLILPETLEESDYTDEYIKEKAQEAVEGIYERYEEECGEKLKFTCEIIKDTEDKEKLEDINDDLKTDADECRQLKVRTKIEGDEGSEKYEETVTVVKVKGKWYFYSLF